MHLAIGKRVGNYVIHLDVQDSVTWSINWKSFRHFGERGKSVTQTSFLHLEEYGEREREKESREGDTERQKQRESDRDHPQNFVLPLNFQFSHEECSRFRDRDTLQEKFFGQNCFDVFDTFFFFFGVVEECGISSSSCRGFLDDRNSTLIWRSVAVCRQDDLPDWLS